MSQSDPAQAPEPDFVEQMARGYIHNMVQRGESAGKSPEQIDHALNKAGLILVVRMLQKTHGEALPQGESLLQSLSELMGEDLAQTRELCQSFVAAGWMEADYRLSPSGKKLSGLLA